MGRATIEAIARFSLIHHLEHENQNFKKQKQGGFIAQAEHFLLAGSRSWQSLKTPLKTCSTHTQKYLSPLPSSQHSAFSVSKFSRKRGFQARTAEPTVPLV